MQVYDWPRCGNSQAPAVYFSAATLQRARQGKAEEVVCTGCMCIRQVHGTQYCWTSMDTCCCVMLVCMRSGADAAPCSPRPADSCLCNQSHSEHRLAAAEQPFLQPLQPLHWIHFAHPAAYCQMCNLTSCCCAFCSHPATSPCARMNGQTSRLLGLSLSIPKHF